MSHTHRRPVKGNCLYEQYRKKNKDDYYDSENLVCFCVLTITVKMAPTCCLHALTKRKKDKISLKWVLLEIPDQNAIRIWQ